VTRSRLVACILAAVILAALSPLVGNWSFWLALVLTATSLTWAALYPKGNNQ